MLSRANTPFSQNVVAARSSAAETTAACRKCPCWQLRAPCWHRSDPQTTAERFKKLNMFNFCRRLLRWILHRVDTVVLPQTPCFYRVCTVSRILPVIQRSSQQPLPDPKLLGLTSSCPSICFVSFISCLQFVQLQNSISLNSQCRDF